MSLDYYHRRKVRFRGWKYLLDNEERTAWITKGKIKRVRRYRIPTSVVIEGKEYRIESVEMGAFSHIKTLRHLVIPDGIQYVDEYNFSFSKSLRSIYIGKDVDYMSSRLFHNNPNLRTLIISPDNPHLMMEDGIVYSKDGTVALCAIFQPRHLHIREGVTLIENVAFWWNPRLEQVDFPTSLPIDLYSEYEKGEFEKMVSQYDIFVPSHLIDAYRQHPYWSKCRSINSL